MGGKNYLLRIFTTLALGAVVVLPAKAGQVRSFVDARGMIHITNEGDFRETSQTAAVPDAFYFGMPPPRDKDDKLRRLEKLRGKRPPNGFVDLSLP